MGKILLFYKYISIEYPKRILKWQRKICTDLNLNGRILIGTEGINATVGGTDQDIERYQHIMKAHELFQDVDFKLADGDASYFPRMEIKIRDEICKLGIKPYALTTQDGGRHLSPQEAHELMSERPEDLVVLDARNNFESRIGTFKGSLTPDIKNFRDLPKYVDEHLDQFKDKRVLMHCTGGVRCERATAYLNQKGIAKEVMQIEGGIVRYTEQYPDGHFRGQNYVFDRRVSIRVNDDILTTCDLCETACDEYSNCINSSCNNQFIGCEACLERLNQTCSEPCKELLSQGKATARVPFIKAPDAVRTVQKK